MKGIEREEQGAKERACAVDEEMHRGCEGQWEQSVYRNNHYWEGLMKVLKNFLYLI